MKLLCDVCEYAVASLLCCADEAALCLTCDSRVHAANKLAGKHQRVPLLSEPSEPALCDICQERPSFFFCVEDRALLCRDCDVSIHSANVLAAKHRRFLLTGIKVGIHSTCSTSQETTSAVALEQHTQEVSPPNNTAVAVKKPSKEATVVMTAMNAKSYMGNGSKAANSPLKARKASAPVALNVKALRSYMMNKEGTLSTTSNIDNTDHKQVVGMANSRSNSTTISIQRISAGRVPFIAPVLSSLRSSLLQVEASNKSNSDNSNSDINDNIMVEVEVPPAGRSDMALDYFASGISGWRLDELLTDLAGVYESGRSLSPSKESNASGFGQHEEPPWYAELDLLEEHELSPSQEKGVALVPEMPSPPTSSGLVTAHGKHTYPAAQSWDFDHLFTAPDHSNEFSVVPDIVGCRSSPVSTASTTRNKINKKRKYWLDE